MTANQVRHNQVLHTTPVNVAVVLRGSFRAASRVVQVAWAAGELECSVATQRGQ
jgi:hypothetical protein